jgi:hypothetical protein
MASRNDLIMQELVGLGFTEGSIVDREYERLLSELRLSSGQGLSLYDLYSMAGEEPRLF